MPPRNETAAPAGGELPPPGTLRPQQAGSGYGDGTARTDRIKGGTAQHARPKTKTFRPGNASQTRKRQTGKTDMT